MHLPLASRSWPRILSVAAAWLLLATALPARAGLIVSVENVSADAGTTGNTLEVDVTNTGGSAVAIAAFSFEISAAGGSGITFTGADTDTSVNTYIFAGNSLFGPTISTMTGTTLDASDIAASGSTSLGTNSTLALGLVSFDVAGSAPSGPVNVTLTGYPATSLSDPNASNIPIDTLNNGTITISQSAIPEPSSVVSATLGFLGAAWLIRRVRATAGPRGRAGPIGPDPVRSPDPLDESVGPFELRSIPVEGRAGDSPASERLAVAAWLQKGHRQPEIRR